MRQVLRHRVEFADAQRRRAKRRTQEHVAGLEELASAARNLECGELGGDIVGRGGLLRIVRSPASTSRNRCPSWRGRNAVRPAARSARYWRRRSSSSPRPGRRRAPARAPRHDGRALPAGPRLANRGRDFGIDGVAIGRLVGEGDAQPAGIAADLLGKRAAPAAARHRGSTAPARGRHPASPRCRAR